MYTIKDISEETKKEKDILSIEGKPYYVCPKCHRRTEIKKEEDLELIPYDIKLHYMFCQILRENI